MQRRCVQQPEPRAKIQAPFQTEREHFHPRHQKPPQDSKLAFRQPSSGLAVTNGEPKATHQLQGRATCLGPSRIASTLIKMAGFYSSIFGACCRRIGSSHCSRIVRAVQASQVWKNVLFGSAFARLWQQVEHLHRRQPRRCRIVAHLPVIVGPPH